MNKLTLAFAALALVGAASQAHAQSCRYVGTVNAGTTALKGAVVAHENAGTALQIATDNIQSNFLVSAVRTTVAQISTGANQLNTAITQSKQAAATTVISQDTALQIAHQTDRYAAVGYKPCEQQTAMASLYSAYVAQGAQRQQSSSGQAQSVEGGPGSLRDPARWFEAAQSANGTITDASVILKGDKAGTESYLNILAGPPTPKIAGNSKDNAAGHAQIANKLTRDAITSASLWILRDIQIERAPDGTQAKLAALRATWTGTDGGATWSAAMAGSHERGALLDQARIEAANIAALVLEVRSAQRNEIAVAVRALARANQIARRQFIGVVAANTETINATPVSQEGIKP